MIVNEQPQKLERNKSTDMNFSTSTNVRSAVDRKQNKLIGQIMNLSIFSEINKTSHFTNNCKIEIIAVLQGKEKYV